MKVWAFDENRADFVDAAPERMNADATGYYMGSSQKTENKAR